MDSCNFPIFWLKPEVARVWMSAEEGGRLYPGQRHVYPGNLKSLAGRMMMKEEFPVTLMEMATVNGQDPRLLDGNHRCTSSVYTGVTIPIWLVEWDFLDNGPRHLRFMEIDHGRPRTTGDIVPLDVIGPDGYSCVRRIEIISRACELLDAGATAEAFLNKGRMPASAPRRVQFAIEWSVEAQRLFRSIYGKQASVDISKGCTRFGVVAVLLPLLRAYPVEMEGLLKRVSHNERLTPGTAAHKLHGLLLKPCPKSGPRLLDYVKSVAYCAVKHITKQPCTNIALPEGGVSVTGTDLVIGSP